MEPIIAQPPRVVPVLIVTNTTHRTLIGNADLLAIIKGPIAALRQSNAGGRDCSGSFPARH